MKLYLVLSLLLSTAFCNELSDKLDSLIKNKTEKKVVVLKYNPFYKPAIKKKKIENEKKALHVRTKKSDNFNLVAIINKKAFINGKWYKEGDRIGKFKIKLIKKDGVVLLGNRKNLLLDFVNDKKILKIREK